MKLSRILFVVAIIVLLFFFIRYIVAVNYNTLTGLNDATSTVAIPSSSLTTDTDGSSSINFTYSIWFYIKDWTYRYGKNKVIFTRSAVGSTSGTLDDAYMKADSCGRLSGGCAKLSTQSLEAVVAAAGGTSYVKSLCEKTTYGCCPLSTISRINSLGSNCYIPGAAYDPCPTMYLGATENDLFYQLSIEDPGDKDKQILYTLGVKNIPIQRWVHSVLCVYGRTVEIYIDGKLARTAVMDNVMGKISPTTIYLSPGEEKEGSTQEVGFSGYTSNLKYYPEPLTPQDVWNLYRGGPGTSVGSGFGSSDYSLQVSLFDGNVEKSSIIFGGSGNGVKSPS